MIKLRTISERFKEDDLEAVKKIEKELTTVRYLYVFAGFMYPLFGYFNTFIVKPQYEDVTSFKQRIFVGSLAYLVLVLSFFVKSVRKYFYNYTVFFAYLIITHLMYIGANFGFTFSHTLGVIMVIVGTSLVFQKHKNLIPFVVYLILMSMVSVYLSPKSELLPKPIVFLLFLSISLILFIILTIKFKAQRKLEESHANINARVENTNDLIWSISDNYTYIAFNKAFENLVISLTGKKPIVKEKTIFELLDFEIAEKIRRCYADALNGEPTVEDQEFIINGKSIYYSFSFNPIRLSEHKIIGVTVFGHNITKAKILEKEILESSKKLTASINYAKRIQDSILPKEVVLEQLFPDSFILSKPREIVSGDFPFLFQNNDDVYIAVVDCTGHGVPGAMLSIIGSLILNEIVRHENHSPASLIDQLHLHIVRTLRQGELGGGNERDGMDIALCKLNPKTGYLQYAGAHLPLLIMRKNHKIGEELEEYKGDRYPIGGVQYKLRNIFTNSETKIENGDKLFLFSDGIIDQFGGSDEIPKKMGLNRLKYIFEATSEKNMADTKTMINESYENWRGNQKQIDDILMIGISF